MPSKLLFCLLFAIGLFIPQIRAAEPEVIDGVAAVVNGDVITFSQVQEVSGPRERTLREQFTGQELIDKIKEARLAAFSDLIDRQLIVQDFKKKSFSMPEYVVDDQIQTIIKEDFAGDRQAFLRTLNAQGYTMSRFREVQKDKVIVGAMRQNNVKGNFTATPQQIQAYYEANKQEFVTPEQLKLRMIVLNADPLDANSGDATRKMADEIREKVKSGADFATMAKTYSMDGTAESGGDWGLVDRKTLNQQLTDVAFALSPGQTSQVVQIGDSFYILYCETKKKSSFVPLPRFVTGSRKLEQVQSQKATRRWIDSLREKAYIKIIKSRGLLASVENDARGIASHGGHGAGERIKGCRRRQGTRARFGGASPSPDHLVGRPKSSSSPLVASVTRCDAISPHGVLHSDLFLQRFLLKMQNISKSSISVCRTPSFIAGIFFSISLWVISAPGHRFHLGCDF